MKCESLDWKRCVEILTVDCFSLICVFLFFVWCLIFLRKFVCLGGGDAIEKQQ